MWNKALVLILSLIGLSALAIYHADALSDLQGETLKQLLQAYLFVTVLCFVVSTISRNYSQVDKLWSVMPIIYCFICLLKSDFEPRITLMFILVALWGIRLTYNFYRRGGYSLKFWEGEEDYRWAILRAKPGFQNKWIWMLFNLVFISFYQMGLILLFTLPILKAMESKPLNLFDGLIAIFVIAFIVIETVADQQQWNFHKAKKKLLESKANVKGFLDKGLWQYVRHPNYASEQMIWILFYLFSVNASGKWINWSIIGCLLLIILFKGSSDFSESISSEKYPEYEAYKKQTGRFIPLFKSG